MYFGRNNDGMELNEKTITDRYRDYYRGERISNAALFFLGGTALFWTLLLFAWRKGHLSAGIFFSSIPLSIFFLISGAYRFWRSFQRYRSNKDVAEQLLFVQTSEKEHLESRAVRFKRKRKIDSLGVLLGFTSIIVGIVVNGNHIFVGSAISITIFSAILLSFDLMSQFRTEEFLHHIRKGVPSKKS